MSEIDFYKKSKYIKSFSDKLRNNETNAEKLLREQIKGKKVELLRFHRQKPIFAYRENSGIDRFFIADFYYHPSRLIIEIDWNIHKDKDVMKYDEIREYLLKEAKYKIIRFNNEEITKNIELVIEKITKQC